MWVINNGRWMINIGHADFIHIAKVEGEYALKIGVKNREYSVCKNKDEKVVREYLGHIIEGMKKEGKIIELPVKGQTTEGSRDTLICLVGASGTGKTTIAKRLDEKGYNILLSYTTREPRGEGGEWGHTFVKESPFKGVIERGLSQDKLYKIMDDLGVIAYKNLSLRLQKTPIL